MVLDEEALEAMLRRQRAADDKQGTAPRAELIDQTDEFEVYERPKVDPTEPPVPGPPDLAPEAAPPGEDLFEELPGRADGEAEAAGGIEEVPVFEDAVAAEEPAEVAPPDAASSAAPDTVSSLAPDAVSSRPPDDADPLPPASPLAPPVAQPATTAAPARPEVWPPLSHRTHAPRDETVSTHAPRDETVSTHAPRPVHDTADDTDGAAAAVQVQGGGGTCRLAIVQATFNAEITARMAQIAETRAAEMGCEVTQRASVPGVYDLPLATRNLLLRDDVDAAVVLGVVVRGETQHDLVITQAAANALQQVALDTGKPIGFGVTGPGMTWAQAEARIGNARHAVDAAVAQVQVLRAA